MNRRDEFYEHELECDRREERGREIPFGWMPPERGPGEPPLTEEIDESIKQFRELMRQPLPDDDIPF